MSDKSQLVFESRFVDMHNGKGRMQICRNCGRNPHTGRCFPDPAPTPLERQLADALKDLVCLVKDGFGDYESAELLAAEAALAAYNQHRKELVDLLEEGDDLLPRMSDDDPMAPAISEWWAKVRAKLQEGKR